MVENLEKAVRNPSVSVGLGIMYRSVPPSPCPGRLQATLKEKLIDQARPYTYRGQLLDAANR